jgi:hypothetical protein
MDRATHFMSDIEKAILNSLVELDSTVKKMATANPKPSLGPLFARLEDLESQLPAGTDPMLRHYMQKKSYQKAMFFLQGRDAENAAGNCGHR